MPRIAYAPRTISAVTDRVISLAAAICAELAAQGFDLTRPQLHYGFVSWALLADRDAEYQRLGFIISGARLAVRRCAATLDTLTHDAVRQQHDDRLWHRDPARQVKHGRELAEAAARWGEVAALLAGRVGP